MRSYLFFSLQSFRLHVLKTETFGIQSTYQARMKQQFKVVTEKINLIYNRDKRLQETAPRSKYKFRKAFTFYQDTFSGLHPYNLCESVLEVL